MYLLSAEGVLPAHCVSQENTMELAKSHGCSTPRQEKLLKTIYEKVAIDQRYSVFSEIPSEGQTFFDDFFKTQAPGTKERMQCFEKYAPELAYLAATQAMRTANVSAQDIGHLVSVSCTGLGAPGFDIAMMKLLKLSPLLSRTHVGFMGCHGVFNAMRVGAALCHSQPGKDALIASVELCSLHFRQGWNPREALGNALFSDGAGAAVISSCKQFSDSWQIAAQASFVIPDSEDAITWRVGDEGFEMTLSTQVRQIIKDNLGCWLKQWLSEQGLKMKQIQSWAVHPGGPGVLDAVEESLNLPKDALETSRETLRLYGNMSSATILFILKEMMSHKNAVPCVALGFGPGMTIEAALFL